MCVHLGSIKMNVILAPPRKWPKTTMLKYAYLSYKTLKGSLSHRMHIPVEFCMGFV